MTEISESEELTPSDLLLFGLWLLGGIELVAMRMRCFVIRSRACLPPYNFSLDFH